MSATNKDREITQLAELLGAVAEQVRTGRIEELRGDVTTLAEVVGATSESLRIFSEEFGKFDVPGLRASHSALTADVSTRLATVTEAIEAKRAELAKLIDDADKKQDGQSAALRSSLEATDAKLAETLQAVAVLDSRMANALEMAKAEIEAELGNKVNASDLSRFRVTSEAAAAKLSETVETMRALFAARHEKHDQRIDEMRNNFAAQVPITFGGIWTPDREYPINCVVSFYGGLWVSIRATREKPAKKSADWFAIISFRGGGGGGGGDTLPSQSGQGGKFLKTDGTALTWAAIAGGGDMLAANNLSDVSNAATAFGNIKQNASTTYSGVVTLASSGGTTAGTVVQATDSRLTDARTPTAHATSHKDGGSDALKVDELGWPTDVTTLNVSTTAHGLAPKLPNSTTAFLRGDGTWATPAGGGDVGTDVIWDAKGDLAVGTGSNTAIRVPIGSDGKFLKASSTDAAGVTWGTVSGGGDMLAANNLSDVVSALTSFNNIKQLATTVYSGVVTLAPSGSTTAGLVVQANDARLSDSRTPTSHATSHKSGGSDAIKLDELAAPTDVTTLNSTTAAHGLLPKLSGSTTVFLRGDGSWSTPAGGSVGTDVIWDAKGDLAVGTGADTAIRVPIGADGKYLKASSADAAGVTWGTISGGGDMLGANNLSDVANAVTAFNNIRQLSTTVYAGVVTLAASGGVTAGTVVEATDSRLAVSTTSGTGLLRALQGSASYYLDGSGTWSLPPGAYLHFLWGGSLNPADNTTYYFGSNSAALETTADRSRMYFERPGTLKAVSIVSYAGTAGSAEVITVFVRLNNTTDYLVAATGISTNSRIWRNASMTVVVTAGDYMEFKMNCPTWVSANPSSMRLGGYVYVE